MKGKVTIAVSAICAVLVAIFCIICLTRIKVGYVGVVYSAKGIEQTTLTQGWHWLSPLKHVKQFPISQQQIVFSDDPSDYNTDEHADWHIDAPANGGMVGINLTVNYNFIADHVVSLYEKFNGMDGEAIVESRVQNSIHYSTSVLKFFSCFSIKHFKISHTLEIGMYNFIINCKPWCIFV